VEEEVGRLPERFRGPVVLVYLQGLSVEEAARRLGCPRGTVLSRLSRARDRLRERLARRGLEPSVALPTALACPAVPPDLVAAALRAAGDGELSPTVMALAKGVVISMSLRKIGAVWALLLLVALTAAATGWLPRVPAESREPAAAFVPQADDEKRVPRRLIYRVTTEFQRDILKPATDLYAVLDATEAVKGGKASISGLHLEDLRKELRQFKTAGRAEFQLFAPGTGVNDMEARELVRHATIGFGYGVGFSEVRAYHTIPNSDITWAGYTETVRTGGKRDPDANEPATSNELVKVYPVRTDFSRYLTSGADCAVVIVPKLDKGTIPEDVRKATRDLLAKLKLDRKKMVSFNVQHVGDSVRQNLLNELYAFAKELGFETSVVQMR
jgi:hypothetical protein